MSHNDECATLTRAFSGFGVDEKSMISILGKWHQNDRKSFRQATPQFFAQDERQFERWSDHHVALLKREFLRLKSAIVLWTMHPWERDARLANEALTKRSYSLLVEIACTRSAEELLGARRAYLMGSYQYHSLYDRSIEEDVACLVPGPERKLLVALVSAYRYEGPKVNEETAKSEAKIVISSIKNVDDDELVRILSTRSKLHLQALFDNCKDIEANACIVNAIQCLIAPQTYFTKVLGAALNNESGHEQTKDALTRVIVTRADVDIKEINDEYNEKYGVSLKEKVEEMANGNYRDFLLTLIARGV